MYAHMRESENVTLRQAWSRCDIPSSSPLSLGFCTRKHVHSTFLADGAGDLNDSCVVGSGFPCYFSARELALDCLLICIVCQIQKVYNFYEVYHHVQL